MVIVYSIVSPGSGLPTTPDVVLSTYLPIFVASTEPSISNE